MNLVYSYNIEWVGSEFGVNKVNQMPYAVLYQQSKLMVAV